MGKFNYFKLKTFSLVFIIYGCSTELPQLVPIASNINKSIDDKKVYISEENNNKSETFPKLEKNLIRSNINIENLGLDDIPDDYPLIEFTPNTYTKPSTKNLKVTENGSYIEYNFGLGNAKIQYKIIGINSSLKSEEECLPDSTELTVVRSDEIQNFLPFSGYGNNSNSKIELYITYSGLPDNFPFSIYIFPPKKENIWKIKDYIRLSGKATSEGSLITKEIPLDLSNVICKPDVSEEIKSGISPIEKEMSNKQELDQIIEESLLDLRQGSIEEIKNKLYEEFQAHREDLGGNSLERLTSLDKVADYYTNLFKERNYDNDDLQNSGENVNTVRPIVREFGFESTYYILFAISENDKTISNYVDVMLSKNNPDLGLITSSKWKSIGMSFARNDSNFYWAFIIGE